MDFIKVAEIEDENVMVDILAAWFTVYDWSLDYWEAETLVIKHDEYAYFIINI